MKNIFMLFVGIFIVGCSKPQIGETWRWRPMSTNENPFRTEKGIRQYYDYKVLDVQDDYVLYLDIQDSTIQSSSVRMFESGAERIKEAK